MEDDAFKVPDEVEGSFVPAVFARSQEEAEVYCELLNDHEIPAVVGDDNMPDGHDQPVHHGMTHGLPVLVPEPLLDEAGAVIASREEAEEFMVTGDDDPDEDYDDEDDHFGLTEVDDEGDDVGPPGGFLNDDE